MVKYLIIFITKYEKGKTGSIDMFMILIWNIFIGRGTQKAPEMVGVPGINETKNFDFKLKIISISAKD